MQRVKHKGCMFFLPVMKNEFESVTKEIICFSNGDENTTSGYIKLTVGYLNFDEDGGAADGLSDDVEYEYDDILKELDNFIYAQNCLSEKDTRIAEIISEAIKTNGDNT